MSRCIAVLLLVLSACAPRSYDPPEIQQIPEPDPDDVASVLFLVGDAGAAHVEHSPLLHRLRRDVEEWSAALARDSAVSVLFLGDNVYPSGVRDPGTEAFSKDTAYLGAQAWTVEGPEARRHGTRAVFIAGNHDWGNMAGPEGVARLENQERVLREWARAGRAVSLRPEAGEPGPVTMDAGPATVVLLDSQWLLQSGDAEARGRVMEALGEALLAARGRPVVLAAHHPTASAGEHGVPRGFGPRGLLGRAGALVQDLNSGPYMRMRAALAAAFAQSDRPLVHAAGHDHTLQVLRTAGPGQPGWTLVSGAGSKLGAVSDLEALEWGAAQPGYMRLVFLDDGSAQVFVESAPATTLRCPAGAGLNTCLQRGVAAYRTEYAARLR